MLHRRRALRRTRVGRSVTKIQRTGSAPPGGDKKFASSSHPETGDGRRGNRWERRSENTFGEETMKMQPISVKSAAQRTVAASGRQTAV